MPHPTVVDTASGSLRGIAEGGALFAGIPFAAPPVGRWRLRPPQPPTPWSGVRDATRFGTAPPQPISEPTSSDAASMLDDLLGMFAVPEYSEDCLYLNVWTPDVGGRAPVIVWFYGGGFESGSAALPATDGAALSRLTGAVVVAANYRLGALGYLHLAELGGPEWADSTNLGLQDQVAALHWVRDNIAAFGGDAANITVAGESAGAFSVGALLATPAAAGTFHKAILSSGSTERVFDADTGTKIAADLLAALGLDTVDDLLDVPVERIIDVQNAVIDSDIGCRNLPGGRSWGVVLDGTVLPHYPSRTVANGSSTGIGLLIGANRDEVRMFQALQGAAYAPADDRALMEEMCRAGVSAPEKLLSAYRRRAPGADLGELRTMFLTDAVYRLPASRLAAAQAGAGGRAHAYLFSAAPLGPRLGACHGTDLIMVFDMLGGHDTATRQLLQVRDELTAAWARFAATGDPGWPSYDPGVRPNTRQFGGDTDMITEPAADEVTAVWETSFRR